MIEIQNIRYAIGNSLILDQVDAVIPKGEVTAIIGPNGAGKSTLLSLASRLIKPDAGAIRVDGHDVHQASTAEMATLLSVLRQENHIASRLRVRDLVSFGRFPHNRGQARPEDSEKIDEALDMMEMRPFENRYLDELSGGQRQRALVAMILSQDTDYILLDEPLNNLDLVHARNLMMILERLKNVGKTPILVIHDINYAAKYATHILALKNGTTFANGPTSEIFRSEPLSNLFDSHISIQTLDGQLIALHH
ncbi:ATP-binding cassette domain-containing protein [Hoeflea sp. CAU 1731]